MLTGPPLRWVLAVLSMLLHPSCCVVCHHNNNIYVVHVGSCWVITGVQYCELMCVITSSPRLCTGPATIATSVQEDTFSLRHRHRPQESNSSPLHVHVWDMPTIFSLYRTMLAQINSVATLIIVCLFLKV